MLQMKLAIWEWVSADIDVGSSKHEASRRILARAFGPVDDNGIARRAKDNAGGFPWPVVECGNIQGHTRNAGVSVAAPRRRRKVKRARRASTNCGHRLAK